MKYAILFCLLVICANAGFAQAKKNNYEFGLNYSIGTKTSSSDKITGKFGGYFEYRRNLQALPLDIGVLFDYTVFDREFNNRTAGWEYDYRSLNVLAVSDYIFRRGKIEPFAGLGVGVSFGNEATGIFNEGFKTNLCIMPRVGVRFVKHLSLTAGYMLTHRDHSAFHLRFGFYF